MSAFEPGTFKFLIVLLIEQRTGSNILIFLLGLTDVIDQSTLFSLPLEGTAWQENQLDCFEPKEILLFVTEMLKYYFPLMQ